jgi:hypothetical protein
MEMRQRGSAVCIDVVFKRTGALGTGAEAFAPEQSCSEHVGSPVTRTTSRYGALAT